MFQTRFFVVWEYVISSRTLLLPQSYNIFVQKYHIFVSLRVNVSDSHCPSLDHLQLAFRAANLL